MSFLVSFEVVEIIFFFLDLELESLSSSRFLFWEAAGSVAVAVARGPVCCGGGGGGGDGGGAGGAGGAAGEGAATAVACTMSFSFLILRSLLSSSCCQLKTIQSCHRTHVHVGLGQRTLRYLSSHLPSPCWSGSEVSLV